MAYIIGLCIGLFAQGQGGEMRIGQLVTVNNNGDLGMSVPQNSFIGTTQSMVAKWRYMTNE